jgi:hypothetical protein
MDKTVTPIPVKKRERYQRVLAQCRTSALDYFVYQMSEFFDNLQPALMDFADKAESNDSYAHFLGALKTIQNQRSPVIAEFRQLISRGFEEYFEGRHLFDSSPLETEEEQDEENLNLVENEEMEEYVALQNIVNKARSQCFQELYALGQRLSLLRGGKKLAEHDIPAGPYHATQSFKRATDKIEIRVDIKIILYALFEKYVTRNLDTLYQEINKLLADAGLFPNLKPVAYKQPHDDKRSRRDKSRKSREEAESRPEGSRPEELSEDQYSEALGQEVFENICELLTTRRKKDPTFQPHPDLNPDAPAVDFATVPVLVSAIADIQKQTTTDFSQVFPREIGKIPETADIQNFLSKRQEDLVKERETLFQNVDRNRIPIADLNMIDVVGMMFEYALSDTELPDSVKALVSLLQIPYIKVAILDKKFLVNNQHIARRLLNALVKAGRDWIDETNLNAGIYKTLQRLVNRIIQDFHDDLGLFEETLEELDSEVQLLEKKARIVEARAKEAARGQERLETARGRVTDTINERIGDRRLPKAVDRFLRHTWLDWMILMVLRTPDAEKSRDWKEAISIIDSLIWATKATEDDKVKEKLRTQLPNLKERIQNNLASLGDFSEPDTKALFALLDNFLLAEPAEIEHAEVEEEPAAAEEELVAEAQEEDESGEETAEVEQEVAAAAAKTPEEGATPAVQIGRRKRGRALLNDEEKAMVERLKKVAFDTWFQFADLKNDIMLERKLSWFSPVTQKYMFVDRFGLQPLFKSLDDLAREMCSGTAQIIVPPKAPFVDRALTAIKKMLGK